MPDSTRFLTEAGFDRWIERRCERFYAGRTGRPGIPPAVYFRMLMIGYLEGIESERGIAWRCADSFSLREFMGYEVTMGPPDHSTLSVIRIRIDLETHQEVFTWHGLLQGKTIGIDATPPPPSFTSRSESASHHHSPSTDWPLENTRSSTGC